MRVLIHPHSPQETAVYAFERLFVVLVVVVVVSKAPQPLAATFQVRKADSVV